MTIDDLNIFSGTEKERKAKLEILDKLLEKHGFDVSLGTEQDDAIVKAEMEAKILEKAGSEGITVTDLIRRVIDYRLGLSPIDKERK